MKRRTSPKPEPSQSLPRRIGLSLKLIKTALNLLEAEGAKTLLCLPVMFLGAYLCLRGVEAGKIVLAGPLMVLLMRCVPAGCRAVSRPLRTRC
jgi:hypothetical protein